jgi:phospholipase/carboxylesterase
MSQPAPVKLSLGHLKRLPRPAPPAGEHAPLLLLLHGVGSNERDLFELAPQLDPRFVVVSLRAPLAWGPDSSAWFTVRFTDTGPQINPKELQASRDLVLKVIAEAAEAYSADPERVYLLGFSQGAIVSYATALTHPRALAGIVACGGRIPPEVEPWAVAPEETAGLPVCVLHGTGDTVLPIEWARKARAFLEARGAALTYHEYDAPHTITPEMLADANAWLADRLAGPPWHAGE